MARIAGVNIPNQKRVPIGLTYIHGIGRTKALQICSRVGIPIERQLMLGDGGDIVAERQCPQTATSWNRLFEMLSAAFGSERYHLGKDLVGVTQTDAGATAHFTDGSSETAELLGTTVASVNSALQRARATMGEREIDSTGEIGAEQQELLDRYADAFERYDMTALVSLLHEDAVMSMPPYALWLSGTDDIVAWHLGPGGPCRNSKMVPVTVNGVPGFAQYKPSPEGGYTAWAIQAPEVRGDKIVRLNAFLDALHGRQRQRRIDPRRAR